MDIISHGLWGGVAFGRKSKKRFWTAFAIGMMPDLIAFAGPFITNLSGLTQGPHYSNGHPDAALIPQYVYQLYSVTHSLIIFALVFGIVWAWRKKPQWLLGGLGIAYFGGHSIAQRGLFPDTTSVASFQFPCQWHQLGKSDYFYS